MQLGCADHAQCSNSRMQATGENVKTALFEMLLLVIPYQEAPANTISIVSLRSYAHVCGYVSCRRFFPTLVPTYIITCPSCLVLSQAI